MLHQVRPRSLQQTSEEVENLHSDLWAMAQFRNEFYELAVVKL